MKVRRIIALARKEWREILRDRSVFHAGLRGTGLPDADLRLSASPSMSNTSRSR